jgi:hypothetical protein
MKFGVSRDSTLQRTYKKECKDMNMNLKKAMFDLNQQREWLGVEWVELFALLQEEPSEFSDITLRAFETYKKHEERV